MGKIESFGLGSEGSEENMRTLGFWILFLVAGAALSIVSLSKGGGNAGDSAYTSHGIETTLPIEGVMAMITNRKLKFLAGYMKQIYHIEIDV